ncbi:MAG: hypothetical protein PHT59_07985, partial [Candidatus Omnitrophica bacterium]|nr:hypothetical protein [Candidatus Omnitrophota bacterium]
MSSRLRIAMVLVLAFTWAGAFSAHAEEIKLVLVGQTHAALYPCHCPVEPDGGIARRATLLKELARKNRNLIVIDSGSFFAGGPMDQNTKGEELDRVRSAIHAKAMQAMGYDAAALGEDEFNHGTQFLRDSFAGSKTALVSANIESDFTVPFVVKKFANAVVGIVGVTSPAAGAKAAGLKFIDPAEAVGAAVDAAKKQGAGVIVLVSGLDENANQA